jgi:hypothetical protein
MDPRLKLRFPLVLRARYETLGDQRLSGRCETVNLSSEDVLLKCSTDLVAGSKIKVVIEWPISRYKDHTLYLHLQGVVVSCTNSSVAVSFKMYQFRTSRPRRALMVSEPRKKQIAS